MSKLFNTELTVEQVRKIMAERKPLVQGAPSAEPADHLKRLELVNVNLERVSTEMDRLNESVAELQSAVRDTRTSQDILGRSMRSYARTLTAGAILVTTAAIALIWVTGRQSGLFDDLNLGTLRWPLFAQQPDQSGEPRPWWQYGASPETREAGSETRGENPDARGENAGAHGEQPLQAPLEAVDWQAEVVRGHRAPVSVPAAPEPAADAPTPAVPEAEAPARPEAGSVRSNPASMLPFHPAAGDWIRTLDMKFWDKSVPGLPKAQMPEAVEPQQAVAVEETHGESDGVRWETASDLPAGEWLYVYSVTAPPVAEEAPAVAAHTEELIVLSSAPVGQSLDAPVTKLLATGEETLKWLRGLSIRGADAGPDSSEAAQDPETWWHEFVRSHAGAEWWTPIDPEQRQASPMVSLWSEPRPGTENALSR